MNNFEQLVLAWLPRDGLAAEFDADFYRTMHPDLAGFDGEALRAHFEAYGRGEGRISTPCSHRLGFLAQIPQSGTVLEIGPAVRPSLRGGHVRYFDIADRDGLVRRALSEGYPANDCPEIHYVSPDADLATVVDTFSNVFSSHCIEHQPDLIRHLSTVADILDPGGRYFLLVPDKRYCFDALLADSTVDEVRAAHREARRTHTYKSIYDHYVLTTHNDPVRHWRGDSDDPRSGQRDARQQAAQAKIDQAAGGYVDVHAWQFTPQSFRSILNDLEQEGLPLRLERLYDPYLGSNEFGAVLQKIETQRQPRSWFERLAAKVTS